MEIVVLNGSPKGETSVTMQYVRYLEKQLPDHVWTIIHAAQRLPQFERNREAFDEAMAQVRAADAVLWSFPLYYMMVHGNYKRFIELIWEREAQNAFTDKYAAALTTSIHYYDHTAHAYMRGVAEDLGMHVTGGFSAAMRDLFDAEQRKALVTFTEEWLDAAAARTPTPRQFPQVIAQPFDYAPTPPANRTSTEGKRIVVVTDTEADQANLLRMVDRFRETVDGAVKVINLHEVDIKGGCLGCLRCGYDNECAYEGKDAYIEMHKQQLQTADILVFAGAIRDRYLSATWKTFFDRSFFKTHTPVFQDKQVAFLISGPLAQIPNLREILEAWVQMEQANLVGIVTDEVTDAAKLDGLLDDLARRAVRYAVSNHRLPRTFLGVAGMKLFRDDIWGPLRGNFRADHRAYKRLKIYDFPQRDWRIRAFNAVVGVLLAIPFVRKAYTERLKEGMIAPYRKVVERSLAKSVVSAAHNGTGC